MQRLIEFALRYRILVLLATVFVAAIGFVRSATCPWTRNRISRQIRFWC